MPTPRWFVNLLERFFPARFFLARMTHLPLLGHVVDLIFFNGDDIIYLPQDHSIHIHAEIDPPDDIVLPSQVLHHFIDQASYHWIMNFCICRESKNCQDYPIDHGCMFLGEAVLKINPKFGRLVTKEAAHEYARECRQAGLVHMVGRNKLDTFWLGAGPGNQLMTVCNCCPCCCLWKIVPDLNPMISRKITRMPGISLQVKDTCLGCGTCTQGICFVNAIHLNGQGQASISEECRGCGRCVEVCPNDAIELIVSDSTFVQQTIERIQPRLDLK